MTDLERLGRHVGEQLSLQPRRPTGVERAFAEFRLRLAAWRGYPATNRDAQMAYNVTFLIDDVPRPS